MTPQEIARAAGCTSRSVNRALEKGPDVPGGLKGTKVEKTITRRRSGPRQMVWHVEQKDGLAWAKWYRGEEA